MSKVIRSVKNVTKGYSSVQIKVREATSNDPWGPTGTQMSEIAQLTYNSSTDFYEIMDMLDKRLNDKGKNWRHVLKALKVLDYCLHEGSELVVTWSKQNLFVIKTLREFIYIDEEGRDVGQNVRIASKELTALILDEERLRAERSDRRTWKSRVNGLEEYAPHHEPAAPQRRQRSRRLSDDEDAEYRLAIEASKAQEEEDRRRRENRAVSETEDDDLAKAIKLSKEEEERRRRELEETNAASLFGDDTTTAAGAAATAQPALPQPTGYNQGYQQGSAVDFFANPIDPTGGGYLGAGAAYTGYAAQPQPTGYPNGYTLNGFGAQPTGYDLFGGPQPQPQLQPAFPPQPTGYNPYAQQQQQQPQLVASPVQQEPTLQPGSNNPWATHNGPQQQQQQPQQQAGLQPMPTGSNNPFAQQPQQQQQQQQQSFGRPATFQSPSMPTLGSLPEQKTLSTFGGQPSFGTTASSPSPARTATQPPPQQKPLSEHEQRLNALLASGEGMDTFGNTGELRIPAQHTAPGTFVNSAGSGLSRITAEATGNNPFLRQQFTGMPTVSYGGAATQPQMPAATGPAGLHGGGFGPQGGGGGGLNNPFAARPQQPQQQPQQQQQQTSQGDLIQF